jgi:hypothetical protein
MSAYQLYINNQRVEIFDDESVSLTQAIQDVRDISKVFTDFSKPFRLPASKENNKIFKHYYRFNLATGTAFDARKKVSARIELNTIPFREGKLKLDGVDMENNIPKAYKVTFFGNTVTLKDVLKEDQINTLNWLNNFNTTYSAGDVFSLLTDEDGIGSVTVDDLGTSTTYERAVICPLISNSARPYYDTSIAVPYTNSDGSDNYELGGNIGPTESSTPPATGFTTDDIHGMYFEDLTYAIRVHLIVRAIQNQYSSIRFSDDFFDLVQGPEAYRELYMLCQNTEGRQFEDMGVALKQISGFSTATALNGKLIVQNNVIYVQGLAQNDFITGVFSFETETGYPTFTAKVKRGGEEEYTKTFTGGTNTLGSFTVFMYNASQGYTLEVETQTAFVFKNITFQATDAAGNQSTHQIGTVDISLSKEFIITEHLPDLKIIDFLTGLFKMFNLTAFEQDGIIHVKTLEQYYSSGSIRDITEYVDPTSIQVDTALPYEEIEFKYRSTGSKLAKKHTTISSSAWGALKYSSNENLDSNNEKFVVEAPFEHLKFEKLYNTASSTYVDTGIQVGWLANENGEPYFKDAVLFIPIFNKLTTGYTLRFLRAKDTVGGIEDITEYWMPSNSVSLSPTQNTQNLHFNLEINEYSEGTGFTDTLFKRYYQFYIAPLFNRSKRKTTINARLPKKFILNYTLADTIQIKDEYYKINNITTNLLTGQSSLELLNETSDVTIADSDDTGGTGDLQDGPDTNVLKVERCADGQILGVDVPLSEFNFPNNTRIKSTLGDNPLLTYKVIGNEVADQLTALNHIYLYDSGFLGCENTTPPPPPTYYYGLERCSDGVQTFRTGQDVSSISLAITQKVEDASNVEYIVLNNNTETTTQVGGTTVTSVGNVTAITPTTLGCGTPPPTVYYYELEKCDNAAIKYYGFSPSSGLTGQRIYQNACYELSSSSLTGTIQIDTLSTCTCPVYYYTLNDCTNNSTIVHYTFSSNPNLAGTNRFYLNVCYYVASTSTTTGTIDIDTLPSCVCETPSVTYFYGLERCSDGLQIYRTQQDVDTISLSASQNQRVEDPNNIEYIVINNETTSTQVINGVTVINVGNVTAITPTAYGCAVAPTPTYNYWIIQRCNGSLGNYQSIRDLDGQATTLVLNDVISMPDGFCYKITASTTNTSSNDWSTKYNNCLVCQTENPDEVTPPPPTERYELKKCSDDSTGHYTPESTSDIVLIVDANGVNGSRVIDQDGLIYTVIGTSTNAANISSISDLSTTGCPSAPVVPATSYWLLQNCETSTGGYVSEETTADLPNLTEDSVNGSRVQSVDGSIYIVYGQTSDPSQYSSGVVSVISLNITGCPDETPPPAPYYYELAQCASNIIYISGQEITTINLQVGDFVYQTSTPDVYYQVVGTSQSGTSIGSVTKSTLTDCPLYWDLKQCGTLQLGYRSDNTTLELPNLVMNETNGTRVQDANGIFYIVVGKTTSGANVGTVTDTGSTGCPTPPPSANYYSLQKCEDSSTGYRSQQDTTQITFNTNDVVQDSAGTTYLVTGTVTSGTNAGVMSATLLSNCTDVAPPTPPASQGPYYAQFISCDDPTGAVVYVVSQNQDISTWWVLQDGSANGYECYRWVNSNQGANPRDISEFTIFNAGNTAGENCIECQENVPTPPPVVTPPPLAICGEQSLYYASSASDLCNESTPKTVYMDANSIDEASIIYLDSTCTTHLSTARYFANTPSGQYYYWNGSNIQGPYTNSCDIQ